MSNKCWSEDECDFRYDSLGDLIDSVGDDFEPGRIVYVGDQCHPDPTAWVDADDILEQLACRAGDEHGEYADDYPSVTQEAKKELQDLLEAWVEKHAQPTFYSVKNVRPYMLTAEDLGSDDATPAAALAKDAPHA